MSMTDRPTFRKWFSRGCLLALVAVMAVVAFQPQYNFAHWVPHTFLRDLGVSYDALLWFESNADIFLHFLGAWALLYLLYRAEFAIFAGSFWMVWLLSFSLLIVAEIIQHVIGRGVDYSDLLFGTLGCFMAYFTIIEKNN
ncbi:MAG: hypothetical protein AAF431_16545 [Pseudomonadota bacterium]